jgi:hypothetical protein
MFEMNTNRVNYQKWDWREIWNNGFGGLMLLVIAGILAFGTWRYVTSSTEPVDSIESAAQTTSPHPEYASLIDVGNGFYVDPDTKDLLQLNSEGIMMHTTSNCSNLAEFDLLVTSKITNVQKRCLDLSLISAQSRLQLIPQCSAGQRLWFTPSTKSYECRGDGHSTATQSPQIPPVDCGYSVKKAMELYDQGISNYDWCADRGDQ